MNFPLIRSRRGAELQANGLSGNEDGPSSNPTSDDFRRMRLAMDGVLPDGSRLASRSRFAEGVNSVLRTTHRQNFLVPPRPHRSFPLSELRA